MTAVAVRLVRLMRNTRFMRSATPPRVSLHHEPHGSLQIARHYIRDVVYGANDGLITTFAVVAGVAGGALSHTAILVVGVANLAADGLSMGVGNYLSIRAHESVREAENLPEEEASPVRHGLATFLSFVGAGTIPLIPYLISPNADARLFMISTVLTLSTLFGVGAARGTVTSGRWFSAGLEMLGLGLLVAAAAYASGALVAWYVA